MLIRLVLSSCLLISVLYGTESLKPPVPTMSDMNKYRGKCKVPEFLVQIPPMMENDYKACVNDRFTPSKTLIEVVLRQQVSKEAEFIKVEPAPFFYSRVYKITYKIDGKEKAMICNDKMTYCLDDKPIVTRKR